MTKRREMIVEDVIYYQKQEERVVSTAKETFYYQFLVQRANSTKMGEINRRAAEDFATYQKIFAYLMQMGYLTDGNYSIDFDQIEGGACFSLNLGKLLEDVDLESELNKYFDGQMMEEYIHTFCCPVEGLRCVYCGAFSFSRFIHDDYKGKSEPCCLACHPLKSSIKEEIKDEHNSAGSQAAVIKRLALIEEYSRVKIPEGKSINSLISDYKRSYGTDIEDARVSEIRKIFDEKDINNFEVLSSGDYDILLINMEAVQDLDVFSEIVGVDYDTSEILVFFRKDGVCLMNDEAYDYALSLK